MQWNPRLFIFVPSLAATFILGCLNANGGAVVLPTYTASITGVGGESSAAGKFGLGAFERTTLPVDPIKQPIKINQHVKSDQIVRARVLDLSTAPKFNYQVLLGAPFTTGATVEWWLRQSEIPTISRPCFHVETTGWLIAWGIAPVVRDRWVAAAASGSTVAIENYQYMKQRVYLLRYTGSEATPIKIFCKDGKELTTTDPMKQGDYVELSDCEGASAPWTATPRPFYRTGTTTLLLPAEGLDADVHAFLTKLEDIGRAGGWME